MAIGLVTKTLDLATEALKLVNLKTARAHVDKIASLKNELLSEKEKGYDSDDPKIEHLLKELEIEMEAATNEIKLHNIASAPK